MKNKKLLYSYCFLISANSYLHAENKPNIVILFADDISAREFPVYGSSVWSKPDGGDTQDLRFRAETPVMEMIAKDGCMVKTCWAATVSSPSRAMMMTGRYAHLHKWWHNKDIGTYTNEKGKKEKWPLYESSPMLIGHIAQKGGYATMWAGKTQMPNCTDIEKYGFDEGCYTPGELSMDNPHTDFTMEKAKGKSMYKIVDNGRIVDTYMQTSYYWQPSVVLVNNPESKKEVTFWPFKDKDKKEYGVNTYGPDVEQKFIFDFMKRMVKDGKPFMIYHTSHLGHDAYNFINPDSKNHWPATPKVEWKNGRYVRTAPQITGDNGEYNLNNSLSDEGIHNHIKYLDYQIWKYLQKFKELKIDNNTIFIICADNGTSRYGKGSPICQKGCHVPMIIYAPCMNIKHKGETDILMNMADILPTIAEIAGVEIPENYEINGESIVPFLTGKKDNHREWIYAYRNNMQLIRGKYVLKDGRGTWYDVSKTPSDLISFPVIKDWNKVSEAHKMEKKKLESILPHFNLHKTDHDAPVK